ncbi:MAG: mechanosensitive ion channel [Polyangiaceae bacterium]
MYPTVEVKVRDVVVLRLKLADGGLSPSERAKRATRAIEAALADATLSNVRTEMRPDRALLFVGSRPIVELTREDAEAMGEGSLELYAASAATRVHDVLDSERRQSVVASTLLNVVLVGALAVGVVMALRWLGMLARRVQRFVQRNPEKIPAIRLQSIEVVGPHVLRSAVIVGVGVLKLVLQFAAIYSWLVFSSSLFEATKGLAGKLTSLVLSPLAGLMTRITSLLPLVLVTAIAVAVLFVLLRFVELFFVAVQRRETELSWLRPELAAPTSVLIRVGLVTVSLLCLGPVVTGNVDGALSRLGMLFVITIALASTPFFANVVIGFVTLYGGRLAEGDYVRLGATGQPFVQGKIQSLGLVELSLISEAGSEIRVAYLSTLFRPITIYRSEADRTERITLLVVAEAEPERLCSLVKRVLDEVALTGEVRLSRLSGKAAHVEVRLRTIAPDRRDQVLVAVAKTIATEELPLVLAEWQART